MAVVIGFPKKDERAICANCVFFGRGLGGKRDEMKTVLMCVYDIHNIRHVEPTGYCTAFQFAGDGEVA